MKTFVIDWGANANGGRYALVQAKDESDAFDVADSIGSPSHIAELKIPKNIDGDRYMEIDAPEKVYEGALLSELPWKNAMPSYENPRH